MTTSSFMVIKGRESRMTKKVLGKSGIKEERRPLDVREAKKTRPVGKSEQREIQRSSAREQCFAIRSECFEKRTLLGRAPSTENCSYYLSHLFNYWA